MCSTLCESRQFFCTRQLFGCCTLTPNEWKKRLSVQKHYFCRQQFFPLLYISFAHQNDSVSLWTRDLLWNAQNLYNDWILRCSFQNFTIDLLKNICSHFELFWSLSNNFKNILSHYSSYIFSLSAVFNPKWQGLICILFMLTHAIGLFLNAFKTNEAVLWKKKERQKACGPFLCVWQGQVLVSIHSFSSWLSLFQISCDHRSCFYYW